MSIQAIYFDGKTSRRHAVELSHDDNAISLTGDITRHYPLADVQVPERLRSGSRKLSFKDGAYLEVANSADFEVLLAQIAHQDPIAVRLQRSWRGVLLACCVTFSVLVLGYLYGLPAASESIAKRLPEEAQLAIGRETLEFLDKQIMAPSELPAEQQLVIVNRFKSLALPKDGVPTHEILFRKSKIGPNAFALPSGQIIMTDEMVKLLGNDDAIMGVLAHELGHLHERHLLRRIIQGSVVGLATTVLLGDASSVIAAIPTVMLDLKYSRDAEREADAYAIAMLKANGISLAGLALTFEKLGEKSLEMNAYLSSHPPATERIERIKKAE